MEPFWTNRRNHLEGRDPLHLPGGCVSLGAIEGVGVSAQAAASADSFHLNTQALVSVLLELLLVCEKPEEPAGRQQVCVMTLMSGM